MQPLYRHLVTGHRGISRRVMVQGACAGVIAALGGTGLASCTSSPSRQQAPQGQAGGVSSPAPGTAAAAADLRILAAALADEYRLLAYCSAVESRHSGLTPTVAPVRSVQQQHVAVLQRTLGRSAVQERPHVPRRPKAAQARLLRELRGANDRRTSNCLAAVSGPLARVFASIAASHAMALAALSGSP